MASADAWADFEVSLSLGPVHRSIGRGSRSFLPLHFPAVPHQALKHNVRYNTVDRLKNILSSFNDQCHTNIHDCYEGRGTIRAIASVTSVEVFISAGRVLLGASIS